MHGAASLAVIHSMEKSVIPSIIPTTKVATAMSAAHLMATTGSAEAGAGARLRAG
jgi:hypothetical protein